MMEHMMVLVSYTVMNSPMGIGYYVYRRCMFLVRIQRKAGNIKLFMSKQDTIL